MSYANMTEIGEDVLDSRLIDDRIAELEAQGEDIDEWDQQSLDKLRAFRDEAKSYTDEWEYGATFILDSYFEDYARELADDIGAVDLKAGWPVDYIDWERAADALKMDYSEVDVAGYTYWVRA